jgi:uncharacterized FAD-dependent dehydrogenase
MPQQLQLSVSPQTASSNDLLKEIVANELHLNITKINSIRIIKKSIDARSSQIKVNLTLEIFLDKEIFEKKNYEFNFQNISNKEEVIIVGAGPAGLFAALRLIELGYKPIVLERGKDVSSRKIDIANLSKNKGLNFDSNYCFGEGGAGTFSDGKLYTRSKKRGDSSRIFEIFHYHGAQDEILYEAHPHIGSDKLPEIIKNIRKTIIDCGGNVLFETKVVDFLIENNQIKGVKTNQGSIFNSSVVILATGHSARDIYELLHSKNISLEAKGFAMGVRVEHPQQLIDSIQYKSKERGPYLPAASYNLVEQVDGRGVYSFCMCPGGIIVPASTNENEIVVNGMSNSKRQSAFANSGIVVEIRPEDIPEFHQHGVLAGLKFQEYVENLAFVNGAGGQKAPAQRLADFTQGRLVPGLPDCSYLPGTIASPIHFWLPEFISKRLQQGFKLFDKKMKGFLTNEALVVGVESRSSSPIRIPRHKETFEHIQITGLYPCGEGAGYAGGITSSAIDGERCAEMAINKLKSNC